MTLYGWNALVLFLLLFVLHIMLLFVMFVRGGVIVVHGDGTCGKVIF